MQSNRYARVRELFDAALDYPEAERVQFVRSAAEDEATANEVIRLLGYGSQAKLQTQQPLQLLAESENQALTAGRRMGKYVLFEAIGEGGMGQVYRARRVDDTEQWVALKVMRKGLFSTPSEDRFRVERQILARLSHPGIAHFIDTGTDEDGNTYVVMELVEGQPLLAYADQLGLGTRARIGLFRQLLAAVSYAHQQLIIHRDIKSANVMVRPDGVVKLLDFGIAKLIADNDRHTMTSDRMYTPLSAAPEQIRGLPCGAATDVYALGILLYELISGRPIFDPEGKTPGEFESLVLSVPPAPMRTQGKTNHQKRDIPADLERIVAKALRKEPERRYGSVEQFDADLVRLLANEPVSVTDNTALYRLQKFLSRNRLASGFAGLSFLATLVGLAVAWNQYQVILGERDRANLALNTMKQAFEGADPTGELGGDLTARQVLERSAQSLGPLIDQHDSAFQDLAVTLIEVQLSLGLMQDADNMMARIDPAARETDSRLCLLSVQIEVEHHQLTAAAKQLDTCEHLPASDQVRSAWLRARIASRSGKYADAVKILKPLLASTSPDHPLWIELQRLISLNLAQQNDLGQALAGLRTALATARKALPADHPNLTRLELVRLKTIAAANGDKVLVDEGKAILEMLRPKYGEDSLVVGGIASLIGIALSKQRRDNEAVVFHERAFRSFSNEFGRNHRSSMRMEINLVMSLAAAKQDPAVVRQRFEDLLTRADRDDLREFHKFVAVEYAKYLGRQRDFRSSMTILTSIRPPKMTKTGADTSLRPDYLAWLNHAYWRLPCADDPVGAFTQDTACAIPMGTFSALCAEARTALCYTEQPELLAVPQNQSLYH
ncbi:hypothetical protein C7S18_04755 [Ahniella affigens]|uniref:Protein kinase domain-containing protein n=1 Tax=Ahniella affigens TaxID=2021234 RepID=A0A2P1PNX6_9GAMM|nr:serine/threonine-protein kinase [Ahniella affigens]AVP96551.1 hypothetical protein C7S18_04755 [Ahniella affigens]